jgi:hypothetical protein
MTSTTCQGCTAATEGTTLCARCTHTAERALANLAGYYLDLIALPATTPGVRRAHQVSDPTGNGAAGRPADPIEEAADRAKDTLDRWVRRLLLARPYLHYPSDEDVEPLARLLAQQVRAISTTRWAGEFFREVTQLEVQLRRLLATRRGRRYAGVCGNVLDEGTGDFCTQVLYADPDSDQVRCSACRMTWPLAERREILLALARDQETNVATIARALVALLDDQPSQSKLERRIQNWIDRDKLERRGHVDIDGKVRKTYRLGDVLDLLLEDRDTREKRAG